MQNNQETTPERDEQLKAQYKYMPNSQWYIYVLNFTEGTIHKVETTYEEIINDSIEDIVGFSVDNCDWMTTTKNYSIQEI